MHIVLLVIYGVTIWLSALAYAAINDMPVLGWIAAGGPVVISGAILALLLLDMAIWAAAGFFRRK